MSADCWVEYDEEACDFSMFERVMKIVFQSFVQKDCRIILKPP